MHLLLSAASTLVILSAASGPLRAEQPPRLPPVMAPQQDRRIEALEQDRGQNERASVQPPRFAASARPAGDQKALFVLKSIHVAGGQALPLEVIAATYQGRIGQRVSQADLLAITAAITDAYASAGYHLSRAIIPVQDIKNGAVTVQIVEGAIVEVSVKGAGAEEFGIPAMFFGAMAERPSRLRTLERALLLVNERPGVRVADTALEEIGEGTGKFRLVVQCETWRVYMANSLDNYGSTAVGRLQASSVAAFNSMLLPGDSLSIAGATVPGSPRELGFGRISYDAPIGVDGIRVGASAARSVVWPGDIRREFRDRSQFNTYEARIGFSPLQTQWQSLTLYAVAGFTNASERDNLGPIYHDHVRTAGLNADYRLRDNFGGWNYASVAFRQGLGVDDASHKYDDFLSRYSASGRFSQLGFTATRYQALIENWSLKLSATGQWASNALLNSQQFYLGGESFGRAFDSGWLSGDKGLAGLAEIRFDQKLGNAYITGYQLYGFFDAGAVRSFAQPKNTVESLSSVGIGARVYLASNVQAGAAVAFPVSNHTYGAPGHGTRFLFSLSNALRLCPERSEKFCS